MLFLKSLRYLTACVLIFSGMQAMAQPKATLKGAWELSSSGNGVKKVVVATDDYLMQAVYDTVQNQFIESLGGPYIIDQGTIKVTLDFHSSNKGLTGNTYDLPIEINGNSLILTNEYGSKETWHRLDDGKGALAGCWQITQRQQNDEMHTIPDGDRKTLKILSGTRFEWAAINTATGEFFGCGGGRYTFENGKYTEHIEFFCKDNTRAGMSLTFTDSVKDSLWYHKGKSTKGDPVYEIWKLR